MVNNLSRISGNYPENSSLRLVAEIRAANFNLVTKLLNDKFNVQLIDMYLINILYEGDDIIVHLPSSIIKKYNIKRKDLKVIGQILSRNSIDKLTKHRTVNKMVGGN